MLKFGKIVWQQIQYKLLIRVSSSDEELLKLVCICQNYHKKKIKVAHYYDQQFSNCTIVALMVFVMLLVVVK